MLGWVSRGWSEGRTRPADLTTPVPRRGKKSPRPQPQKNRPRRGRSGIKEGLFRRTAFCLKKSEKFSFAQKRPPRVVGVRRFYESISWEKKERPTNSGVPAQSNKVRLCGVGLPAQVEEGERFFIEESKTYRKKLSPTKQEPPRRRDGKRKRVWPQPQKKPRRGRSGIKKVLSEGMPSV